MATPTRAYTGATRSIDSQRFPEVYAIEHQPERAAGITLSRESILIALAALALWYGLSKAGHIGPQPDPSWAAPAPAQPSIVINDNSWNVDICGVCTRGNASPHFVIGGE